MQMGKKHISLFILGVALLSITAYLFSNGCGSTSSKSSSGSGQIMLAYVSTDEGQTFSSATTVSIPNMAGVAAVDPCAILLDDGRIRMYYFGSFSTSGDPVTSQPDGINRFYSAISIDGITFSEEAEVITKESISDPFVLKDSLGNYVMYISSGSNVLSATSTDGLDFTWNSGTCNTSGGVPGAILLADNSIRLYFHNSNGIKSAKSSSGSTTSFVSEEGFRISTPSGEYTLSGDPNPLQISANPYLMCFKKKKSGTEGPSGDYVFIARSTDEGYTWTELTTTPVAQGSVPSIVKDKDGRIILYTP